MRFDYRMGKEATFNDWVDEGTAKARMIIESLDKPCENEDNNTDRPEACEK